MSTTNLIKLAPILFVVTLTVFGCNKQNADNTQGKSMDSTMEKASNEMKKDSKKLKTYVDDATVTASVKAAILAEPGMNVFDIEVTTNTGTATLKGNVSSSEIKDKAGVLVAKVEGVEHVNNELVVKLDE